MQFGEGGAGTFSDGKLYSQIKDPQHHGRKVLEEFVKAGAPEEILYISKPHIGTFRLVGMVEKMRATITELGGEVRFGCRVEEIEIERDAAGNGQVRGVVLADGERILSDHVVLAVGHSARDTFHMLYAKGVYIEAKPFSIGVRIEHPQALIDKARFGPFAGHPLLGAADYKLVHHCSNGRSAYSFCMCPGGTVVAATSEPGRVVTNGMSQYSRNERNANSGNRPSASRRRRTTRAIPWPASTSSATGNRRLSKPVAAPTPPPPSGSATSSPGAPPPPPGGVEPSYTPGVHWTDLSQCLPSYVVQALREALPAFDKQIRGFAMADAVMTGVETRTSSPHPHQARRRPAEPQHPGPVPGRRRRRLRRGHPLRRGGRHQGGRSRGPWTWWAGPPPERPRPVDIPAHAHAMGFFDWLLGPRHQRPGGRRPAAGNPPGHGRRRSAPAGHARRPGAPRPGRRPRPRLRPQQSPPARLTAFPCKPPAGPPARCCGPSSPAPRTSPPP